MSEEAASGSSKLDSLSKDDLIKLIKKYVILQKQLKTKNEELTNKLNEKTEQAPLLANATSTDDLLEQEKFKEFQVKINELNKTNVELVNENIGLKNTIDNLNTDLEQQMRELELFRHDLQPQLDSARREIELNKSMLDMLNNEIQLLNSEKLDLEKRVLTLTRRGSSSSSNKSPPSVILEEDEAEAAELAEDDSKPQVDAKPTRVHRSGRKRHRRKANGAAPLERIIENEEEEEEDGQSEPSDEDTNSGSDQSREDKSESAKSNNEIYTHHSHDHVHINHTFTDNNYDLDLLHQHQHQLNKTMTSSADGVLILNKQIEDMTFYVDELKSELEAEREKSHDFQSEIRALEQRLERVDEQEAAATSSLRAENERLQRELVDALLRAREIESSSGPSSTVSDDSKERVERLLSLIKEDLLTNESTSSVDLDRINADLADCEPLLREFVDALSARLRRGAEQSERVKYIETQMAKAVQDFKQEISSLEQKLDENQKEYINFKLQSESKIKSLQSELDSETKKYHELKSHLEKSEKEASKSKLLDLEMADYEKTVKSQSVQLISKDKEIGHLKQEIGGLNEKISKLKVDVEAQERERDSLNELSTQLKQELVKAQRDANDTKHQVAQLANQDSTLKTHLEAVNLEIDNYKLKLADMTAERQRLSDKCLALNEAHQRAVEILENRIKLSAEEADEARASLSALKSEYENYKVKVQHAFKKQKEQNESSTQQDTSSQSQYQKALLELDQAKSVIAKLNVKVDELTEKIKLMDKENELMQDEYARALDRNTKLLTELRHKEAEWKQQLEESSKNSSAQSQETLEIVKNLKMENEALALNYKEKIKQINLQSCQTIDLLQAQLQESKDEIDRLCKQLSSRTTNESHDAVAATSLLTISTQGAAPSLGIVNHISSPVYSPTTSNENSAKNPFLRSTERQQGEGVDRELLQATKSMSPDHKSANTTNISLEELLSEPATKPTPSQYSVDAKAYLSQIEQLKSDLNKGRLQLEHLNELLNESELNNARLTDQINLLKEEIRRLERNQEREKSISNMEYLKNVVLRFLTFSSAQEKAQLLPVLSTMLKLSQEEQNAIMAKGAGSASGAAVGEAPGAGWSSYLPKW